MGRKTYPRNWLARRWHSLFGLWLVIYLAEHLFVNSQAALFVGGDGSGFIRSVNAIHELPFLPIIELVVIGLPFFLHGLWGVAYAYSAKFNSVSSSGKKPALQMYARNHAFTWQRLTSWVLLVGIILHVIQMRFLDYPHRVSIGGGESLFLVDLPMDEGLYTVASRIGVSLMNRDEIVEMRRKAELQEAVLSLEQEISPMELAKEEGARAYDPELAEELDLFQRLKVDRDVLAALLKKLPKRGQVLAISDQFGKVSLLSVRATFRDPWMIVLYTLFVLAAAYHGFRGLWSFMIVWGLTLTPRSQQLMSNIAICLMVVVGFLGVSAAWLTYWVNLRY